jgi:hypothetical protein
MPTRRAHPGGHRIVASTDGNDRAATAELADDGGAAEAANHDAVITSAIAIAATSANTVLRARNTVRSDAAPW